MVPPDCKLPPTAVKVVPEPEQIFVIPEIEVGATEETQIGTLEMVALKPVFTKLPSDVNRIVREPVKEVMAAGKVVQLPLKSTVPPTPTPSKTVTKSQQHSNAKLLNVSLTPCPPAVGLITVNPFAPSK